MSQQYKFDRVILDDVRVVEMYAVLYSVAYNVYPLADWYRQFIAQFIRYFEVR